MVRYHELVEAVDKRPIEALLESHFGSMKFTIDDNGGVNVIGYCIASIKDWRGIIPVKFVSVSGGAYFTGKDLISLEGSPRSVGGNFNIFNNNLSSLKDGPIIVGGNYICSGNKLTSLKGLASDIGGKLICSGNDIISLDGLPDSFTGGININLHPTLPLLRLLRCQEITFGIYFQQDVRVITAIMNKYCGDKFSRSNVIACQKELIDNGFEGNASW